MLVVKLLLLSQVFVLGRLKTHGDELCAGQHLAASLQNLMLFRLLLVDVLWRGCPCQGGWWCWSCDPVRDELNPACCPLPAARRLRVYGSRKTPPLHDPEAAIHKSPRNASSPPAGESAKTLSRDRVIIGWLKEDKERKNKKRSSWYIDLLLALWSVMRLREEESPGRVESTVVVEVGYLWQKDGSKSFSLLLRPARCVVWWRRWL